MKYPQSMDEAREHVLHRLEAKYREEFILIGNEREDYQSRVKTTYYLADYAPAANPDQVFQIWVAYNIDSEPADNYSVYFFKEEGEALCERICETKDYIESYTVELTKVPNKKRWTREHTIEEFMGEGSVMDPYNYVTVYLEDGLTDEQYAEQISDLMKDLNAAPCAINIEVQANSEMIYWNNIYNDYKPGYSIERILVDIERRRIHADMNAQYEARNNSSGVGQE